MSEGMAVPEGTSMDRYLLPFRLARELAGDDSVSIAMSTKLKPGSVSRNRYFVDVTARGRRRLVGHLHHVVQRMALPEPAWSVLQRELERLGTVRYLGVAESQGNMTFKVYLGAPCDGPAATNPPRTDIVFSAIGWRPGSPRFEVKEYRQVRVSTPLDVLRQLAVAPSGPGGLDPRTFLDACIAILMRTDARVEVLLVTDRLSRRRSLDFGLLAGNPIAIDSIRRHLDEIAIEFAIADTADYRGWLQEAGSSRLEHLSMGTDRRGRLFFTGYHDHLQRPTWVGAETPRHASK